MLNTCGAITQLRHTDDVAIADGPHISPGTHRLPANKHDDERCASYIVGDNSHCCVSDTGTAILLISSDMPEMITLADRIAVMDGFRIRGELPNTRQYGEMSAAIMDLIHRAEAA